MDHATNRNVQIGNICQQWSSLEFGLACSIYLLAGLDPAIGSIILGQTDARQRATIAFALAERVNAPKEHKNAIKQTLEDIRRDLNRRRHRAVHGAAFGEQSSDTMEFMLYRGRSGEHSEKVSNDELAELGKAINLAALRMFKVVQGLANWRVKKATGFIGDFALASLRKELKEAGIDVDTD